MSKVNNPCGHTGFESEPCKKCGYPDPVKAIEHLEKQITDGEMMYRSMGKTLVITRKALRDAYDDIEKIRAWRTKGNFYENLDELNQIIAPYETQIEPYTTFLPLRQRRPHKRRK
jgi:hypothetical protein